MANVLARVLKLCKETRVARGHGDSGNVLSYEKALLEEAERALAEVGWAGATSQIVGPDFYWEAHA